MAKTILFVDDDAGMREMFKDLASDMLKDSGLTVEVAKDGQEALAKIKEIGAENLGAVVSDYHMPLMNGIELVKLMKADPSCKDVPIFLSTSKKSASFDLEAQAAGVTEVFGKPGNLQKMLHKIADAVEKGTGYSLGTV